ncbi:chemotaxis protein CheB, partial [Methylopila musalis]
APVRALAIGASTGGPQALASLLSALSPALGAIPVLVTQHMPATFTAALAEHLGVASRRPCREAVDGEPLAPGAIYVAPGGRHLVIARRGAQPCARLDDGPPENYCKPSVDPMFRSAAGVYGGGLLAVVLTGMGSDGACGARAVAAAGGSVIAQDEATSVVWGMPGAAVATGVCSAVLPLAAIAPKITRLVAGERA